MQEKPVRESLQEYGRGVIGGLIFSLPVLYTMEMWWASFEATPQMLLLYMALTFVLLLGYNAYAGLRENASWKEVAVDSIEEMGIGMVLSFLFLLLLGRLDFAEMSLNRIIYMVVIEAMAVAIGVSIGTAQLGSSLQEEDIEGGLQTNSQSNAHLPGTAKRAQTSTLELIALSVCAGMILVSPIAPTEEVYFIAITVKPYLVLVMVLVSLVLNGCIMFYIGFRGSYETPASETPTFLEVVWNVCITYATAFCISAGALWFFGRFDNQGFQNSVHMTVILSVVASLGASAGRLLLDQANTSESEQKKTVHEKELA